jgi:hypothetical protein
VPSDQPCDECAQMERRVLVASIVTGALMGAVVVFVVMKAR